MFCGQDLVILARTGAMSKRGKDKVLPWSQRLEIAIDTARGLWFLHTYSEGCIVHRDIKPTNIFLGMNFEAKLSEFGLSKVIDQGNSFVSYEAKGLTKGGSSMTKFAEPKLDGYSTEAFDLTLKLALSCTTQKRQRPSMEQVGTQFEMTLDISTGAKSSTPPTTPGLLQLIEQHRKGINSSSYTRKTNEINLSPFSIVK